MAMQPTEISLTGLRRRFREGKRDHVVLDGVDLAVERGETVALRGRSGSGKSTLLNLVGGIDAPDAGTISVAGVDLSSLSEHERTLFVINCLFAMYLRHTLSP